jgi:ABC-type polysaccharide/polyol phosphate export permease
MCTPILQQSGPLLKSLPTHPLVYLSAQLFDNCINFLAAFTIIFIPVSIFEPVNPLGLLLLPLPILVLITALTGMAWLLSTIQVFLRDTRYIVTFTFSISYFLTPIFYPIDLIPQQWQWLIKLNPFYILITPFRNCIYNFDLSAFCFSLVKAAVVAALLFAASLWLWRNKRNALYFYI